MSVKENLERLREELPAGVHLVAVSKTHPVALIREAYDAGQRDFGENKVQELLAKAPLLPTDIRWHLIGHLQTNKVKYITGLVSLIHSVDSLKLLREIDKRAAAAYRVVDCLLQVHIAEEESKFGFDEAEIESVLTSDEFTQFKHVRVVGLMGMASFTDDHDQVQREFATLRGLYESLRQKHPASQHWHPEILSMGMSCDYRLAIAEGSNMVRIGSGIFGERTYLES